MNARLTLANTLTVWLAALFVAACDGNRSAHTEAHEDEGAEHAAHEDHAEHETQARADQTTIAKETAEESGIRTEPVGAGSIRDAHEVQGLLTPVEGRHARVRARFPGPVTSVHVGVGDLVKGGQSLAVIESNVSLSPYTITAPFSGTILDVEVGVGDLAGNEPLFELADLSTLWVDLHLFGGDAQHIAPGLPVEITRLSDGARITTKLDRILPSTATASQSTVARATIRNADGHWRPGTAVRARVTVSERKAELVVPTAALQTFESALVVFVHSGEVYTARAVRIGGRDAEYAEVLEGLTAGEDVVVQQSYLIKADLEKAGAAHDH